MTTSFDLTTSDGCIQAGLQALELRKRGYELIADAWEKLHGKPLTLNQFVAMTRRDGEHAELLDQMFLDYMENN